jgi:hypothetical protein
MTQKMFEAKTEAEAEKLADEWIKAQSGIRVTKRIVGRMKLFDTPNQGPSAVPRGVVVVEYDEVAQVE